MIQFRIVQKSAKSCQILGEMVEILFVDRVSKRIRVADRIQAFGTHTCSPHLFDGPSPHVQGEWVGTSFPVESNIPDCGHASHTQRKFWWGFNIVSKLRKPFLKIWRHLGGNPSWAIQILLGRTLAQSVGIFKERAPYKYLMKAGMPASSQRSSQLHFSQSSSAFTESWWET